MANDEEERRARAKGRASWPGRLTTLTDGVDLDPGPDLGVELMGGTMEERIAAVWTVTQAAWALAGWPIPTYARADAPGVVIRPEDGNPRQ